MYINIFVHGCNIVFRSEDLSKDEFYFEWFEIKLFKRNRDRELSHQPTSSPWMFDVFEPLKMKLILK